MEQKVNFITTQPSEFVVPISETIDFIEECFQNLGYFNINNICGACVVCCSRISRKMKWKCSDVQ